MARTNLTVQTCSRTTPLEDPTANAVDAANGNSFDNSSTKVILIVNNGSGGNLTLTVDFPQTLDGLTVADRTYTIPTGEEWVIGPFPSSYNQTNNSLENRVLLDWSTGTSVTCKVIQVPSA